MASTAISPGTPRRATRMAALWDLRSISPKTPSIQHKPWLRGYMPTWEANMVDRTGSTASPFLHFGSPLAWFSHSRWSTPSPGAPSSARHMPTCWLKVLRTHQACIRGAILMTPSSSQGRIAFQRGRHWLPLSPQLTARASWPGHRKRIPITASSKCGMVSSRSSHEPLVDKGRDGMSNVGGRKQDSRAPRSLSGS